MKIIALNSSPRKDWNTALVLKRALEGAASTGADTEYVHLNDISYRGCQSCFACKTKGGESYGKCGFNDDLTPVLNRIEEADAFIMGSPIYFGEVPGMMRNLMERLVFPRYEYTKSPLLSPRRIRNAHVYTMKSTTRPWRAGSSQSSSQSRACTRGSWAHPRPWR
jgi:multimeric flavodoxin WrbA